jgi:hypothetical protein
MQKAAYPTRVSRVMKRVWCMRVWLWGWVTCRMRVKNLLIWNIGPHCHCSFTYKGDKIGDDMKRMELRKKG